MGNSESKLINAINQKKDDFEIFKIIHDYPDSLNHVSSSGSTALMVAIGNDNLYAAKLLIEKGADLNIKNNNGKTALMYAAKRNNFAIAKLLIDKGADLNIKDNNGYTALMFPNDLNFNKLLIDKGADLNIKNNNGNTILSLLSRVDNNEIFYRLYINKGADVNIKNDDTILIYAIKTKDIDFVKLLIKNNIQIKNPSLILDYCKSLEINEIYEALKNYMLGFK